MISVSHLTKYYGSLMAVDDLSFEIDEGHVYGFLGPNGAGKTTTMNIMTGCLSATAGSVQIDGYDIFEDPGEAKKADRLSPGAAAPVFTGCRKSGLRHFFEVFIAPLRLRRGQGAMQGNPCYARLFADLPYMPPNPIKA